MSKKSGAQRRAERDARALGGDAAGQQEEAGRSSPPSPRGVRGLPTESLRGGALQLRDAELFPLAEVRETIQWEAERYFKAGLTGALTLDQVTTLILTGRDLGLPPSQALTGLYVEEGKIAMQADLMRALILRSGTGIIEPVVAEETRCVVRAVRYGRGRPDTSFEIEWTMGHAQKAGLLGKKSWKEYPRQMLFARATSEAGRTLFSDVLCGVIYTPEELGGELAAVAPPPAPAIPRQDPPKTPPPGKAARTPSGMPVLAPGRSQDPATAGVPVRSETAGGDGKGVARGAPDSVAPARSPALASGPPDTKPEVSEKPTQRALTTVLHGEASGGGVATILTAGLTKPQLQLLKAMTTPEGGHLLWERHRAAGAAYVKAKGLPSVLHLTEAEGHELIAELSVVRAPRDTSAPREAAVAELERVIVAAGQERQLVVETLCRLHGVETLEDLDVAALVHATDEVREMCKDEAQMQLVLERLRQQSEIGA